MPNQITGIYSCNDGGFYYARFVGNARGGQIFWFGEHSSGAFSNVMFGELNVFGDGNFNVENGRWWDVPKGSATGASSPTRPNSQLELQIENNEIRKSLDSGAGFGGARWQKIGAVPPRVGIKLSGFTGEGLTGVWLGNSGGAYYVRQVGSEVVWFGEACSPPGTPTSFANVFVGTLAGSNVTGSWADVPYGGSSSLNSGSLSFRVEGDRLIRTGGTGSNTSWIRSQISDSTIISALQVTITVASSTPGRNPDDIRQGSVEYGTIELTRGRTLPRVSLNEGRGLNPGQFDTTTIPLPPNTRLDELVSFTLEHDGAPRNVFDSYDNWDVGKVEIAIQTSASTCPGTIVTKSGQPFVRLTGENRSVKIPI
ncbi:hypothetical protein ACFS7Z_21025 [Pontibacter toksunensis]|uniref:Uncharacterized protein n=1 Tax=Pontibacter toksunensis TaxID=1332631 RepID=A0ABW6BYJ7_9BACT